MCPEKSVNSNCVFCAIAAGTDAASIVCADALTMAFVDLRQFHPGHTLVIPRAHVHDVRDLDAATGAALMNTLSRVTRAVGSAFQNEGLSVWHSIGAAAFQEVPHLHFHVHPRVIGDDLLQVYPHPPKTPGKSVRDGYAAAIRTQLDRFAV